MKRIDIRVTDKLLDEINAYCSFYSINRSNAVRYMIANFLSKNTEYKGEG